MRRSDRQPDLTEGSTERIEQPGPISRPYLYDSCGFAGIRDQFNVRVGNRAAAVGTRLTALHRSQDPSLTCLQAAQLLDQVRGVWQISRQLLVDAPVVHRHTLDRVQHCRSHLNRMERDKAVKCVYVT